MKNIFPKEFLHIITGFLVSITNKQNIANCIHRRANILLLVNMYTNNSYIARRIGCSYKTVIRWRLRTHDFF